MERGCTGGLTPHRSPDVCAYSLSAVQKFGRVIGQYAADDAAFCVCHPNHPKFADAVRTLWALWLASFRLWSDSTAEPIRPAQIQPFDAIKRRPRIRRHPAVVTHYAKALRQRVLQKSTHELTAFDSPCLCRLRLRRRILKRHRSVCAFENTIVTDRHSKHIRSQILQHRATIANGLHVYFPPATPHGRIDILFQICCPQRKC